jgi:uncharacterized protein
METITYNLSTNGGNSTKFYQDLREFTDKILNGHAMDAAFEVNSFLQFQIKNNKETSSYEETFYEFLSIGVLMENHGQQAFRSMRIFRGLSKKLYAFRKNYPKTKPVADSIRGMVSTLFLAPSGKQKTAANRKDFAVFVDWLKATGEYQEECRKLEDWSLFFSQLAPEVFARYMNKLTNLADVFSKQAKSKLGRYTFNVDEFHQKELPKHRFSENYLFCGKTEAEYHLNMFGAEILNRALLDEFERAFKKILLLPTCMSKPKDGKCKSIRVENKMYCTGCSNNCNINIYRKYCNENGISVNLIPHSSSFTKYLKEWENRKDVGLIGVACVLNLMTGGYEMKKLNIPSQCIFLDYCGCKKHWHAEGGIPTNIDFGALEKIAQKESYKKLITYFS